MDGLLGRTPVGPGAHAEEVARTLTVIHLGRDLLRAIELGTAPPTIGRALIHTLTAATHRADDLGVLQLA